MTQKMSVTGMYQIYLLSVLKCHTLSTDVATMHMSLCVKVGE